MRHDPASAAVVIMLRSLKMYGMQKLRGLVSQQMTMMGTWFQSEQAQKDLAQARREQFFSGTEHDIRDGQTMEPRW